jgi:hypothetical protein
MPESTQVFKLPRSELSPIMSDNVVGYAEFVHDILDEFHYFGRCNVGDRLHFDPVCEFIHCYKNVCESTFGFFLNGTTKSSPQVEKGHMIGMVCN